METTANKSLTSRDWVVIVLLAVLITALPHLVMSVVNHLDSQNDEMVGADIGGGLLALLSPIPAAFIIGILKPLGQHIWIIAGVLALLLGAVLELTITGLSLPEVLSMSVFNAIVMAMIVGCGVLGSKLRKSRSS